MNFLIQIAKTTIAGALAGFAMKKVDAYINQKQHPAKSERRSVKEVFSGERRAVRKAQRELPIKLDAKQRDILSQLLRYGLGIAATAATRTLREKVTGRTGPVLGGALFGVGSYVLIEQLLQPLLGLAPKPSNQQLEDQVRGIISHAVYGLTDNAARQLMSA